MDDRDGLFFCGRANDVIWTRGETVFSPEVECIVGLHERVETCVVVPLPDDQFGKVVTVAIVLGEKYYDHGA